MPGRKKKFIDKKSSVTFHLVHRSQRDPLQADDEASQRVLVAADDELDENHARQEEQRKFGVFYDDDYDYLQHLRDLNEINDLQPGESIRYGSLDVPEAPKLQLPSSVFASELETDTGLLNKAFAVKGPQPDWDPDIVAALDEDFDFNDPDNILEDDFIVAANAEGGSDTETPSGRVRPDFGDDQFGFASDDDVPSDEADFSDADSMGGDLGDHGMDPYHDEETKSRFTNYSLSSSVMHRNEGLTLLDDRFEKLFEQYEETEIGALDHEDLEGHVPEESHLMDSILEDFQKQQEQQKKTMMDIVQTGEVILGSDGEDSGVDDNDLVKMVIEEPSQKWDCESILSTYSNIYNHPRLISEPKKERIQLTSKLGIPSGVLPQPGLTHKQVEQEMRRARAGDKAPTYRPKDESIEEKRERKKAVKAERQERRAEKKANKVAFKVEKKRQENEVQNVQRNLQAVKIT